MRFLARILLNAVALMVAAYLVPGLALTGLGPAFIAGLALALVNTVIKPILIVLTLPFTLVTLGLFLFVVNAICLGVTAWLVPGFAVSGFGSALLGAVVVSLVNWVLTATLVNDHHHGR